MPGMEQLRSHRAELLEPWALSPVRAVAVGRTGGRGPGCGSPQGLPGPRSPGPDWGWVTWLWRPARCGKVIIISMLPIRRPKPKEGK